MKERHWRNEYRKEKKHITKCFRERKKETLSENEYCTRKESMED